MTDPPNELIARAQHGEPAAIETLLEAVAPRVRRFGLRFCGTSHDADDALQDTLLAVAQHIGQYDGRSSLASWVLTLTRNACLRRRRGLKNAPPRADVPEMPDRAPSPEARAEERELANAVHDAVQALPLEAREVILLRDVEDLSAAEAASILRISQAALKSRLHRARSALRDRLRPWLEPEVAPRNPACPDVMALWSRKLEGELSQLDCAAMETHLRSCRPCSDTCGALKRALDLCRQSAVQAAVPSEVQASIKTAVRRWAAEHGAVS